MFTSGIARIRVRSLTKYITSYMSYLLFLLQIRAPSGIARTYRFATQTVDLPAQEGERVTISLAAPSNVYRYMGPLKIAARSPGFKPGEPMCLTNHINGQVSKLLRTPSKNEGSFFLSPYLLVCALAFFASGDAASAFIDPSLPRLVTATVIASAAVGTTLNQVVLPEIQKASPILCRKNFKMMFLHHVNRLF